MLNPRSPIAINGAPLTLTGSLAVVPAQASAGGDGGAPGTGAVPLLGLTWATVSVDYTFTSPSATGRPILQVQVSRDPPSTAPGQVTHWQTLPVGDPTSFSAGAEEFYPTTVRCNPVVAGETTYGWPGVIDVRGFGWLRVLAADADGSHPGTLSAFLVGGV